MNKSILPLAAMLPAISCSAVDLAAQPARPAKPNVIVLLTDDLGYGDVGCYGAKPEHVKTPNIDRLAAEGLRLIDGHAASSVCTPSRCSLLTGDYAFRHPRGSSILPGDAPLFIKPGSFTLPAMFKSQGYVTGVVGKWHLGLGEGGNKIDWNGTVKPGPNEIGFDESYIIPATGDRVPTVFLRNGKVDHLDPSDPITVSYQKAIGVTYRQDPDLACVLHCIKGHGHDNAVTMGVSRIGYMKGGKAALWKDEDMADTLAAEAAKFIENNRNKPFFLYYATHNIHEPRVPNHRFVGKSGCGTYGDHILELDDEVGKLLSELKRLGIDENTLIVFSSDNGGCSWFGYDYGKGSNLHGHQVNGVLRGEKGSIWEVGTREPFIVRWPGHVPAGQVSSALVSQTDLLASFARLIGAKLPDDAAVDSQDVLDALLGKSETGRAELLEHLYGVPRCALRSGTWKLINGQLFDLASDLSEKNDLSKRQPDKLKAMSARLKELITASKTR